MIRCTAPVRVDLAGGWTDVPPFAAREGGEVVNAAITLRVSAQFTPGGAGYRIVAEDLGESVEVADRDALGRDARLVLHQAALRLLPVEPGELRTRSDVPPGSGLGSSGAMDVALLAALARVRGEAIDPATLAARGYRLEAVEAGIPGGRQDQYAAALGGVHHFRFLGDDVRITPLRVEPGFLAELERRMLICYTGRTRVSGGTIARVMGAYQRGDPAVTDALRGLVELAGRMREALAAADLARVAQLLSRNWELQQRLDPGMRTEEMARLETAMTAAGAIGGKAAGSGAGGCMMFILGADPGPAVTAAERAGARVLEAGFSPAGVMEC